MARVLHIVESMQAGGAEHVVTEYALHHDRSRYEPEVCCVISGGPLVDTAKRAGVRVHVLGRRGRFDTGALVRLVRIIRRGRFDVVHNHNFTALTVGVPAAILAGVNVLVRTEHNVTRSRGRVRDTLSKLAAMREDAQIAVSGDVRRTHVAAGRIPPERFVTIRNGIEGIPRASAGARASVRVGLGLLENAFVCLNVGSLTPQKNRRTLLEAAARLKDMPNVRFVVVGSGPEEARLKGLAEEMGLSDRVSFLGQRLDVPDLLAASDIFVLSSDWEGLPITILEAMSAGVPCVTTDVGGIPEVLTDGETGILVPPRDPDALAAGVRRLAGDAGFRRRIADAAEREFERRFRSEQMVRQTEALYDLARSGRTDLAPGERIKVLYVIGQLDRGGAERQTAELATRVPRDLFEPVVCCLRGPGAVGDEMEDAGIRVIYLGKRLGIFSGATWQLANVIRRERPAIVHSYLFSANWRCLLTGRLMRVPLIVSSVRNVDIHSRVIRRAIEWILAGLTDRVIANARAVKDYVALYHRVPAEKIEVIYNGINLDRADGGRGAGREPVGGGEDAVPVATSEGGSSAGRGGLRAGLGGLRGGGCVAMVASLTPKKDHATFLESARLVQEELPEATFRLIGDGPMVTEVASRIEELGLRGSVRLLGLRDDIGHQLSEADVSVLTSLKEGCSNVILESMAAGRPVVATDVGGNRELIEGGRTGYLVPPGDAAGIARRVVELLRDDELRQRMGEAGRERARSLFTAERMVQDTTRFYLSALASRVPGLEEWVRLAAARGPDDGAREQNDGPLGPDDGALGPEATT